MTVSPPRWPGVPQLRMRRPTLDGLAPVDPPEPYRVRTYRPGDETAWLDIMRNTFGPSWTLARWRTDIVGRPQFAPANLFLAVRGEIIVGSASAWRLDAAEPGVGYIQLVGVRPDHRGYKLGYWLTLSVLHRFRAQGLTEAILDTEDHRLAAIELYLRLCFEPLDRHPTHEGRWAAIYSELGRHRHG